MPPIIKLITKVFYIQAAISYNGLIFHSCFDSHINKINQLHAVSRTQQGRQREPCVKILRSPLSADFWRHCVLSGTQRRA